MNYANFLKLCSLLLLSLMLTNTYAKAQSFSHTYPATTLAERLKAISKDTNKSITFDGGQIQGINVSSFTTQEEQVEELLTETLYTTPFTYKKISDNSFVIIKKQEEPTNPEENVKTKIMGTVVDNRGEPVIGASIMVKGSDKGVATDIDGFFSIEADIPGTLSVSYIGYVSQDVSVSGQDPITILLQEDLKMLEEVVVIGYGTTKRRDLVGVVEQIDGSLVNERANMNTARSLQGQIPGLNISLHDGKPSRGGTIQIRGTGSIGAGGSALILVDGVECDGDLTTVNPADIESVTVLKDASSAAIYGSRGAFGVILITTKSAAAGKPVITYNGSVSFHQRLNKPDIVSNGLQWTDGWYQSYMEARDQGIPPAGVNNVFKYSTDWYNELVRRDADPTLEKVRVNSNGEYEYFGNTNWFDIIYKDFNVSTEHNVSVSGGDDRTRYYVSARYFNQDGIYKAGNEDYTQYNVRAKGQIKLSKQLLLENNTDFIRRKIHQPMVMYDRQNIARQVEHQGYPVTMEKNPDGTWTEAAVYIGWAGFVEGTSYQKNNKFDMRNSTALTYTPMEDQLIFKGDFTYFYNHSERIRAENMYEFYNGPEITGTRNTFSSLEHYSYDREYLSGNLTGNYIPKFNNENHKLNILAGWNIEHKKYTEIQTYRRGLIYPSTPSFALMDGDYYTTGQGGYEYAYVGFLFRANYNLKDKYLAEVSGRYDGSSKFPENQQWGFFPSASLGWRFSQEGFLQEASSWLDNGKLRLSVGSLGNSNVDPFLYMSNMNIAKTSKIIGDGLQTYTTAPGLIPSGLTWETSTTYDIGLDLDMLGNRINFVFDYYQRYTTDMYTLGATVPAVLGADVPKGNNADMKTKGWEVSLQWRDSFKFLGKPFNYSMKGMVWDSRSWITKYNNPDELLSMTYYKGMELGEIWGYHVEGIFKDQAEIDAHADQSSIVVSDTNILKPGDLKFADLNGDGKIDTGENTVENPGDRRIIGNSSDRYNFGFNLSANWNGFGLSAFIQGVGKKNWYPARESAFFWGQYNRPYSYMLQIHTGDNVWTEENQNTDAYWPRYRAYLANSASRSMGVVNDRYLQNVAYVRLKNVQLDYTFKKSICDKLHIKDLRVYIAGENLFSWSPMYKITKKNMDPEVINAGDSDFRSSRNTDGDGYGYPMLNSYTLGINVTF